MPSPRDHAPARAVDKELPFGEAVPGMTGLETTLGLVLEAVAAGRLGLVRAMRALSLGPWRALEGGRLGCRSRRCASARRRTWSCSIAPTDGRSARPRFEPGPQHAVPGRALPGACC